ncbi:MAG TPA: TetR/AcrR family transcriptional regulator, partial [Bacteroidales bacterium]|nr:TetR/AcrR family transcriptional regulator [Bacteroidales bacterium]
MGTKERKQRELEQRKKLIIEKSKELFFIKGFSKVTIQDICDAVEYGKSAVYNIFDSKEEIYGYVYIEAVKILADLTNEINVKNANAANTFSIATEQIFKFYKKYTPYYKALFFFDSNHMAVEQIPEKILKIKYDEKERAMQPVRALL